MSPKPLDSRAPLTPPLSQDLMTAAVLSAGLIAVGMMAGHAALAVLAGAPLMWFARRAHRAVGAQLFAVRPASSSRHRREG